jgi:hypothetical protein
VTFRFANVEGRSALVDPDGRWFEASRVSAGVINPDPMAAMASARRTSPSGRGHSGRGARREHQRRSPSTTDSLPPERVRCRAQLSLACR